MGEDEKTSNLGKRLFKQFLKLFRIKNEKDSRNGKSGEISSAKDVTKSCNPPGAPTDPFSSPPPVQNEQNPGQSELWSSAADSLDPADRDKLDKIFRSSQESPDDYVRSSRADVNSILARAEKLKEQGKEAAWRPVVDKIIQGLLTFKSLGDAAVKFDKSAYAALGWSIVSFGLQIAANAGEAREFVLSNSEIITRFMVKYKQYERLFRGPDVGEDFDRLLTNVYKAILLYLIAFDTYLRQSRLERLANAAWKLEDRSINARKKAIDTADAEVRDWLVIILLMRHDNSFSNIRGMLQNRKLPGIPEASQGILESLYFREMDDRFHDIEPAAGGTCKWLLRHEKYKDWTDNDHGTLCIKGKPGSGKSTLLHYAVSDAIVASNIPDRSLLQNENGDFGSTGVTGAQPQPSVLILSFFFHDRGTYLQKTPLGLFRSLLHQLLRHVPSAIPDTFLKRFRDLKQNAGEASKELDWKWRELRHFFEIALQKALKTHRVCFFIDALDEYGEDDANELIKSFNSWMQACPSRGQFHICFTCRHHPPLDSPEGMMEIFLEEENKGDISTYVQTQLYAWSNKEDLATIWMEITDRASGVFIWARLIVLRILYLERKGDNERKIREEIEQTPQALEDLYKGLVKEMETDPNSLKLMEWICFAMEPLTLDELRWAMVVDPDYSEEPASLSHYENTNYFATNCDMMEKKLKAISCGLAEAVPSSHVVQFIHQSVKDFFITEGLLTLQRSQDKTETESIDADLEGTAHYRLSRICIRYFSAQEIMQSQLHRHELASFFPFLRYAAIHWIAHVQKSEEKVPQVDLLRYFRWPHASGAIVQQWLEVRRSFRNIQAYYVPFKDSTMLHITSRYHLMGPLREILKNKESNGVLIDASNGYGTALVEATDEGHEDVVRLLLENGANANAPSRYGNWALPRAAYIGNEQIVRVLLEYNADTNAQSERYGFDALQIASEKGHEQIVKLLLDKRADVNGRSILFKNTNALKLASKSGHERIVQILLEHGAEWENPAL